VSETTERPARYFSTVRLTVAVFTGVFLAICLGVVMFAPERLPSGVGVVNIPLEVTFREALLEDNFVAVIENPSGKTLHNVKITCSSDDKDFTFLEEDWAPGRVVELGWAQGWGFEPGHKIAVSASGYSGKAFVVPQ